MKTLILILLFSASIFAQSPLLNLMDDEAPADPYGSELCGNPTFTSDTWWVRSAHATYVSGAMRISTASTYTPVFYSPDIMTTGKTYHIVIEIKNYSSGVVLFTCGNGTISAQRSTDGIFTEDLVCGSDGVLTFYSWDPAANLDIDNVSIKEVLNP